MIVPFRPLESRYPDSDGQPMADNTLQFEWITTLKWGLDALFADRPDVFVAGDHLIYPVDDPKNVVQVAPDVYVAFGRLKGHRGSYKVWEEAGIFPQVVFEVWSPGNRFQQMEDKRAIYEKYGAEEYYIVYPDFPAFVEGWVRKDGKFDRVEDMSAWVSPRLGIRFRLQGGHLEVLGPDGTRFLNYVELSQERDAARVRAAEAATRATEAEERAARLAARLRELGLDPDAG